MYTHVCVCLVYSIYVVFITLSVDGNACFFYHLYLQSIVNEVGERAGVIKGVEKLGGYAYYRSNIHKYLYTYTSVCSFANQIESHKICTYILKNNICPLKACES